MLSIDISTEPDFQYLIEQLSNPQPFIRAYGTYRTSQFNQQVALGLDPYDRPLRPLSAAYETYKKEKYGIKPKRVARGDTVRSHYIKFTTRGFTESISSKVAVYLQYGTSQMSALPLLPLEGIPAKDQNKMLELAEKYIKQSWRNK